MLLILIACSAMILCFTTIRGQSMPRELFDLTGDWEFREYPAQARRMRDLDGDDWLQARVPSSIYTCLVGAGQIDPADLNANPEKFSHISRRPWIFRKTFDVPGELLQCGRIDLVFDGLDTVAQIWLNDKLIGKTDNMFIGHRFDVTKLIKPGGNRLLVKLAPAEAHAERLMNRYGKLTEFYFGSACRSYIRKAQYQFGWDWCPALPGCGIFRPVRLEGIAGARIEDLHVRTIECSKQYADIVVAVKLDTNTLQESSLHYPLVCKLALADDNTTIEQTLRFQPGRDNQSTIIRLDNPRLWWPNGCGRPNLYKLNADLYSADQRIDHITRDVGIRTVHLNRTNDRHGQTFRFEINHQPVYVRGANWVPLTIFPGSQTPADYEALLTDAAGANINMLRVWGGGYYEDPHFYELCDRLGIMVWQDFMFACSYYPDRSWFLNAVKTEAVAVIKRLRSHPSLVLWCGNNEIDWLHTTGRLGKGKKFYGKAIYHRLLGDLLSELDRERDYIPTTPFSNTHEANDPGSGTVHHWDIWSGNQPGRNYTNTDIARFVTEFGLQSLPDINTTKTFCTDDRLRIATHAIEKHNYQLDGNARLFHYLAELFGPPADMEQFVYLTQLTQARRVREYVEYLRAHNDVNSGVLFWQFNDCCPAVSWSAVDYLKKPKALYFYARRFFAPVLPTLVSQSNSPRPDIEPLPASARAVVVNDMSDPLTATLVCRLMDMQGNLLDKVAFPLAIGPLSTSAPLRLPKALVRPRDPHQSLLQLALENDDGTIAQNNFLYLPDKYMDWPKTQIVRTFTQLDDRKWTITLKSDTVAKDLQITTHLPAQLSDNYVDLIPQQPCELTIDFARDVTDPDPLITLRSVK